MKTPTTSLLKNLSSILSKIQMKHLLFGVILLTVVTRCIGLEKLPLYWEEVALGFDAYSLLQTGMDHHGNHLPFPHLPSFGDYKPAVYAYVMIPFLALFDLSSFAVRAPSALAGVLTVYFVYQLGRKLVNKNLGLLAAFFLAIQPWALHLSRVGFETNLATLFIVVGVWGLIGEKDRPATMIEATIGIVALILSMATYQATKISAPLLGLLLLPFWIRSWNQILSKNVLIPMLLGVVFLIPVLVSAFESTSSIRLAQTTWLGSPQIAQRSNEMRELDPSFLGRLLSHRYLLTGEELLARYLQGYNLRFFFLHGDDNARHQPGLHGLLWHLDMLLIPLGLFWLWNSSKSSAVLIGGWILIAGLPQALTTVSPHTLRFATASPAFAVLSSAGAIHLWILSKKLELFKGGMYAKRFNMITRALGLLTVIVVFGWQMLSFGFDYSIGYPVRAGKDWQEGYQELYDFLSRYDEPVVITREQGRPAMYAWFMQKTNPRLVQQNAKDAARDQLEYLEYDNYSFVDAVPYNPGQLVASSPEKTLPGAEILHSVTRRDGVMVWQVWRLNAN